MSTRTETNTSHLVRLGIVSLFCVGMALYCLYDGFIGWPQQRIRYQAWKKFEEEHADLEPLEIDNQWKEFAAAKGWPTDKGKDRKNYDIAGQFLMAGVIGPIGLFFLVQFFLWRGRWIKSEEMTLTSSRGDRFELSQIVELDKKKWQKKGIAKVKYEAEGKTGKLILDDCNYERDSTNVILRHIEANIDHGKIVGGKPEPPPKPAPAEVEPNVAGTTEQ